MLKDLHIHSLEIKGLIVDRRSQTSLGNWAEFKKQSKTEKLYTPSHIF